MNFTKEQRHEIYKLAKKQYITDTEYIFMGAGMCVSIAMATGDYFGKSGNCMYVNIFVIGNPFATFPELKSIMPAGKRPSQYWWPVYETETRIKMFNKIIEQTKP